MAGYRLGVDVGGTNTDIVLYDEASGAQLVEKLSSTPSNPAIAILEGIDKLVARGVQARDIGFFAHGTTVTTNALLEHKGVPVGLFISDGYSGVIEVQTQQRGGNMFDYTFQRPHALVAPDCVKQIGGRIGSRGEEIAPLDTDAVRSAAQELAAAGIRSFAICYIFSFMNPRHEQMTAQIIRSIVPDATVSMSSAILPRIREWPRFSTTLLNAYLEPALVRYIDDLSVGLDRLDIQVAQRFLMQSNGGVMPFSGVKGNAVHTLLSGPAAGVRGTCHLLARGAFANLITMDIGGTSCDIAFIEDGKPHEVSGSEIEGRHLDVPSLDIVTIAAGGGTIAHVDRGGFLVVGPESAGATPGPACFGRGGTLPTVTDAYILCGFMNESSFLGGSQKIDAEAARRAILTHLGEPLGLTPEQAAEGLLRIVNARIADQIALKAAKTSVDVKDFTLVAFGGAGPVHAAAVAKELGIDRFLVPFSPGAFSALGLLCSDIVHDFLRSDLADLDTITSDGIEHHFKALEEEAAGAIQAEGLSPGGNVFSRELDMRYAGQGYELRVPLGQPSPGGVIDLDALREAFHTLHEQHHGHSARDGAVEIVSYRLRSTSVTRKIALQSNAQAPAIAPETSRRVRFGSDAAIETPVVARSHLPPESACKGPAVIVQFDTTTIVPPGWTARIDGIGNMIVERAENV
ncbi:MAG: hydantoinase/oxoprolinase family protein [Rhizobiaceae bacterium]